VRVLHFSDIHVSTSLSGVPIREFVGKRIIGLGNLTVRRGKKFEQAAHKVRMLADFMHQVRADVALCTGDYTALGTEPELENARRVIEPFLAAPSGFVTVPGNHDLYLPDALADGRFERHFGDLLVSDLPEYRRDGQWPTVRLIGEGLAVVCVNSARPNPQPWLSSGFVPEAQLQGLSDIVEDPRVSGRFVIVATHYAPRLANGQPDHARHGLDNANDFLAACSGIQRGLVAHGHVHRCYEVRVPEVQIPLFGAGSATHQGHEGIWVYDIAEGEATAVPGSWTGESYALLESERRAIFTD